MSKENAKKFIEDSKHNYNLKKEFENLIASFGSNVSLQDKKSKAAKFMTKHGYNVIASDLKDDIFSKTHDSSDSHELSLDELDNVAGGIVSDLTPAEKKRYKQLEDQMMTNHLSLSSDEKKEYASLYKKRWAGCTGLGY